MYTVHYKFQHKPFQPLNTILNRISLPPSSPQLLRLRFSHALTLCTLQICILLLLLHVLLF